jgi:hypothetical protein
VTDAGIDAELDDDDEPSGSGVVLRLLLNLRDNPWEWFALLGTLVFVAGWAGIVYLIVTATDHTPIGSLFVGGAAGKIYFMLTMGTSVTTASGVLWGVAALVWRRRNPSS